MMPQVVMVILEELVFENPIPKKLQDSEIIGAFNRRKIILILLIKACPNSDFE